MSTLTDFELSSKERQNRSFSESFKIKKVREIECGLSKISDICKVYSVSHTSVYKWLNLYGMKQQKTERLIVETLSDTQQLGELKHKIAELERALGQKQILIDFQNKLIELAEDSYGIDIKKNSGSQVSSTSGNTVKS